MSATTSSRCTVPIVIAPFGHACTHAGASPEGAEPDSDDDFLADIARALRDEERAVFKDLRQSLGREIVVRSDVQLHHEQFDLMAIG